LIELEPYFSIIAIFGMPKKAYLAKKKTKIHQSDDVQSVSREGQN